MKKLSSGNKLIKRIQLWSNSLKNRKINKQSNEQINSETKINFQIYFFAKLKLQMLIIIFNQIKTKNNEKVFIIHK